MVRTRVSPKGEKYAAAVVLAVAISALAERAWAGELTGDAARGETLYEACQDCHSLDKNDVGPRHRGVFGRKAASLPDYDYSDALKSANIVWNEETLDKWLTDPQAVAPGAKMFFHLDNPQDRADVIAHLKERANKARANGTRRLSSPLAEQRFRDTVLPLLDDAYSLAKWLSHSPTDAEDIVQDAALRALQALSSVSVDRPKPWFLAIVRNAAMTFMARNRRKTAAYAGDMTDLDALDLRQGDGRRQSRTGAYRP